MTNLFLSAFFCDRIGLSFRVSLFWHVNISTRSVHSFASYWVQIGAFAVSRFFLRSFSICQIKECSRYGINNK